MRFSSLLIIVFFLAGCGYHVPGQSRALPADVEKLYIQPFVNKTTEPRLEYQMTRRVSDVFSRNSTISQVENLQLAEAVLHGTVRDYQTRALSYASNDEINQYIHNVS